MASHLLVLGHAEGASWVLRENRMAWTEGGAKLASRLAPSDGLFLYASSTCWVGRRGGLPLAVFGKARVLTAPRPLDPPVRLAGRRFAMGVQLFVESLAPFGSGLPLSAVAPRLELFAGSSSLHGKLRRSPVLLSSEDTQVIDTALAEYTLDYELAMPSYPA